MRAGALLVLVTVVLLAMPAGAHAEAGSYTACPPVAGASILEVAASSCESASAVVQELLAAPPESATAVLRAAGWTPLRARPVEGANEHDLVALRGLETLRVRRSGAAPDLDGWSAGRELLFARKRLVGGKPAPKGSVLCTSSFLVRLRSGRLGGLSAAHCGGLRRDRTVQRRNAALRRPPAPGIVLGRVLRMLTRTRPLDALVLRVPSGDSRPAAAVIDRGIEHPPWRVVGTASPRSNRAVCMAGRTSGRRCGVILGRRYRRAELAVSILTGTVVRCTTIVARAGDSGGPVYTRPTSNGTVHAIGITALIVRGRDRMCFTPVKPVLRALRAKLVAAPG